MPELLVVQAVSECQSPAVFLAKLSIFMAL
jgi:hypothetical protein